MAGFQFATFEVSRERIEGLMFFRVVLVTLLLGSAVAVDIEALSALSDFKNAALLALIVTTYALTIAYAVLIRRIKRLDLLAAAQIFADLATTVILVAVTGFADSLFLFLFLVTIINSAVVLGRRAALFSATVTATSLVSLSIYGLSVEAYTEASIASLAFRVGANSAGAFVIAILSGYLAERLSEATAVLEEQQLDIAELRALNANILASLSSGLITVDRDRKIIYSNRAASELTALSSEELLGANLSRVFPDLDDGALASGQRYESRFEREDGTELHFGFSVSLLRDSVGDSNGNIIIFQDLTEIRALEEQMQRSQRLAAVGELAAGIAHEIRNPLASISGSVEMLRDDEESSEENRMLMSIVMREVERLNDLITEFLNYSRPRTLQLSKLSLQQIIREICQLFQAGDGDTEIEIEIQNADGRTVLADEEAMRQVVWNLLKNGAEACEISNRPAKLYIEVIAGESTTSLAVEDDGPGLDDKAAEHIFEPFYTTKDRGTGLGLATIYRIIEDHGGVIRHAPPTRLRGARFEVILPRNSIEQQVEA